MLNAEKYKDKLIEIRNSGHYIAIINGEPMRCEDIGDCHICRFVSPGSDCNIGAIDWMLEEYEEPQVDWSKVEVDTPILVRYSNYEGWRKRHFAGYANGEILAYNEGRSNWSAFDETDVQAWKFAKLAEDGE